MSFINWGSESPEQLAMRRQLEQQALFEQAIRMARSRGGNTPGVGGGSNGNPRAKVISAQNAIFCYADLETDKVKIFVINYDDLSFSKEIETGFVLSELDSLPYINELIDGKGWNIRLRKDSNNDRVYFFVDAGGNLIEKVEAGNSVNDFSFDGLAMAVSYTDPNSNKVVLKWWGGDVLYSKTFDNVDSSYVLFDWFGGDGCTEDGTFSIYYDDVELGKERVYLVNAYTGVMKEITDLLEYSGEGTYRERMYGVGNLIYVNFQVSYNSQSTASYVDTENFITLSAVNPNIAVGFEVTGPSININSYITAIDGTTVYLSNPINSTEEDVTVTFNGQRMDLLRIIRTDGTTLDIDTSSFNQWGINESAEFGTGKLAIRYYTQTEQLPSILFTYCHSNGNNFAEEIDTLAYPNYAFNYDSLQLFTDYNESPLGAETFYMICWDEYSSIDGIQRLSPVKFFWTNPETAEIYTNTPSLGVTGFDSDYSSGVYNQGTYTVATTTNGSGTGATFTITVDVNKNIIEITVAEPGQGYLVGDELTIAGTLLGGASPANNVTLTVNTIEWFGIANLYADCTQPLLFYSKRPDSNRLEILNLNTDGSVSYYETPTLFADAGSYFEIVGLGDDYTLFTHYDDSRPDSEIQFFGVWTNSTGAWVDNDYIWVTTNNGWGTNYDTFYMSDNTENRTYYWTSAMGDATTTIQFIGGGVEAYGDSYRAGEDSNYDYTGFHRAGTTLLVMDGGSSSYLLQSNFTAPVLIDQVESIDNVELNANYFYNLQQLSTNSNNYTVHVYDNEGALVNTVDTDLDSYGDFRVAGNRAILIQNDGADRIIRAISPASVITKTINSDDWNWAFNDWRAFDY